MSTLCFDYCWWHWCNIRTADIEIIDESHYYRKTNEHKNCNYFHWAAPINKAFLFNWSLVTSFSLGREIVYTNKIVNSCFIHWMTFHSNCPKYSFTFPNATAISMAIVRFVFALYKFLINLLSLQLNLIIYFREFDCRWNFRNAQILQFSGICCLGC